MSAVVGTVHSELSPFMPSGLTFTRVLSRVAGETVTWNPTSFDEIDSTGIYLFIYTPSAAGLHEWVASRSDGPPITVSFEVTSAAADGAALATAIADVQATADAIDANVDAPVSSRASAALWTSARAAKLDLIGSSSAVVLSPMGSGTVTVYQGDTYDADDSRALVFTLTGAPDLAGAVVTLLVSWGFGSFSKSGTAATVDEDTQSVTVELTSAETDALPPSPVEATYALIAHWTSNDHTVTLQRGTWLTVAALPTDA